MIFDVNLLAIRTDVRYDLGMLEMLQTGEEIGYQLITIRKVIDQLELKFSKLAADFVKTDFWEEQGSASPYDWVRFNCHMTSNAAGDRDRGRRACFQSAGKHPGPGLGRDRLRSSHRDGTDGKRR